MSASPFGGFARPTGTGAGWIAAQAAAVAAFALLQRPALRACGSGVQ
ncbi:hypothetical protein [Streptomyces sp. CB00455]|nr:hypothetical protein [Streptomyces sp. CB00455]